jgi:hypothetical protein
MMKAMHFTFFDIKGNGFILQGQSTSVIMWKYYSGCVKLYVEKGLTFGSTIGFSTMTMIQLKRRCPAVSGPKN